MREFCEIECTECRRRNYTTFKNKKTHSERIQLKKYCPSCRRHTGHREIK